MPSVNGFPNEPLHPLQKLVAEHYEEGVFKSVIDTAQVEKTQDPLFCLLMNEAASISGPYDYYGFLDRTIGTLRNLQAAFD